MISAILLAAGLSSRMGNLKQLLPFRNKTFIDNAINNLIEANTSELILVLGHQADEITSHLSNTTYHINNKIKPVINSNYLAGMTSSIQAGIKASNPNTKAFLIALVDQPQITTEIINLLIINYLKNNALIVKPSYQGKSGHPIIIDACLKEEILNLSTDVGLNKVTRAHLAETLLVEVTSQSILLDFDTPEDYKNHSKV